MKMLLFIIVFHIFAGNFAAYKLWIDDNDYYENDDSSSGIQLEPRSAVLFFSFLLISIAYLTNLTTTATRKTSRRMKGAVF